MAEPAEEEATPEERLAWLRARGVTVEEPGARRGPAPTGGGTFTYVKIPLDESLPCEERSGPLSKGDALPALLGPEFAGCSLSDDELRAHSSTAGQAVDISVLRAIMEKGSAEHFRLAVPTDENGRQAVLAYLDESSSWKGLPKNQRASTLARQCGFPPSCEFFGDIFVSRQQWNEAGEVVNMDFRVGELEPGSLWIRRATTENLEFQKATRPEEHDQAQASGSGGDKPASGETEGYSWKDEGEELEVIIKVPEGTTKKAIKVEFKRQEVRILQPVSLSLQLLKPVEVDGCSWTMGGPGQVVLTLEKSSAEPWHRLLK